MKGSINFDANDRFALDGQRLIAISGADGGDGTEYRLEFDPTSRIRSYGVEGSGPQRWEVETKAGLKMVFSARVAREIGQGAAKAEVFKGITGTAVSSLEASSKYPSNPDETKLVRSLDNPITLNDVGQRVTGFIVPKVSGNYKLYIASDNESRLRFNPAGTSPGGLTAACSSPTVSHYEWTRSATQASPAYALTEGVSYAFEVLHKGDFATNHYSVAWSGPGMANPTLISPAYFSSTIPGQGGDDTLVWALSSITDSSANAMLFEYDSSSLRNGELLLTKVAYTQNAAAALQADKDVTFEYEQRPDVATGHIAGFKTTASKRLVRIESHLAVLGIPQLVRRYTLTYRGSFLSGRSLLSRVGEQSPDGTTRNTGITWRDSPAPSFTTSRSSYPSYPTEWRSEYIQVGDVNCDGLSDMVTGGNDGKITLFLSLPAGGFQASRVTADKGFAQDAFWMGDFNGDGHADILTRPAGEVTKIITYFGQGNGTFTSTEQDQPVEWNHSSVHLGDFDGDGRTDFLVRRGVDGPTHRFWRCFMSNGDGTYRSVVFDNTFNWDGVTQYPGDFNGDGRSDFLTFNPSGIVFMVLMSNGDGTFTDVQTPYDQAFPMSNGRLIRTGDFNGDGITDAVFPRNNNEIITYFFDGKGGIKPVSSGVLPNSFSWQSDAVGDFNGDGFLDLFASLDSDRLIRFFGNGQGGFTQQVDPSGPPWLYWNWWLGDFDGDGKTDFSSSSYVGDAFSHYRSNSLSMDMVDNITTGHGSVTSFAYQPLCWPQNLIHAKGDHNAYPYNDIQTSVYAVSSMSARNGLEVNPFTGASASTLDTNTVSYRYEGACVTLNGRGFQGFAAVESTDEASGIISRTEFSPYSPELSGRPIHTEQRLQAEKIPAGGSGLISSTDIRWTTKPTTHPSGRKSYLVGEGYSLSHSFEVNRPAGTVVKTVFRGDLGSVGPYPSPSPEPRLPPFDLPFSFWPIVYDDYGNLLRSTTIVMQGAETFSETILNSYADVIASPKWHLGRLATSTVTKSGPNPAGAGSISLTRSSAFGYDPATGLLTQEVIEPSGASLSQQKTYSHDVFGNILTSTVTVDGEDVRSTTTTYTPDGRFVARTTNAADHAERKTYDPLLGNVLTQTGPNGLTTSWEYDSIGRPIKETRPDGTETRSFYQKVTSSTAGAPPRAVHYVRVQSSGSAPKTVWYDLLDREIRTDAVGFDGRVVSTLKVFNSRGEVTHGSQPYFSGTTPLYTTFLYDAVGREQWQTDPGTRVTQTMHNGLSTSVTNPKGQTVGTDVNAMGWTVQSTQDSNKSVYRKYDPYGNLRFVTDSSGGAANVTEMRYDVRGNKVWMSEPNSGVSTFTYNGFGELQSQTNAVGETVTFTYDLLGRVKTRTEPEGVTTFTYDTAAHGIGQLASEVGPGFERRYFYDSLGRPAATTETHGFHTFSTSRSYDLAGRPDILTYPTGFATQQVYTANGHLSEVRNANSTSEVYWRALLVNARGQVTREALGNGIVTDRSFVPETGLVQDITSTFGSTGDVQKLSFGFDVIGNLTERKDMRYSTPFVEGFGYDALNRLQNVTTTGAGSVTTAYDAIGNITQRSDVGTFSYSSSRPHALTTVSGGAQSKTCAYDLKGNRTLDGNTRLEYSSFNKLVRIRKGDDSSILGFDYGSDRTLSTQTIFQVSPLTGTSQTIREYVGAYEREMTSEGVTRHIHHIAGGSGVVAIHTDERSASGPPLRTRYVHKDHLGSVDAITDENGSVVERQSFDAWGRRRNVTHNAGAWTVSYPSAPGSAETRRGFTGHEMLDAVGLIHMGGRIYDPLTSRFLSPDPFIQFPDNQQNLNRYSYVLNNPLSFTDPSGFFLKSIGKFFKKHWKTIVSVGVGIALAVAVPGSWGVLAQGFAGGFGSSFSGTLLAGGSVGDALRAGLKGGVIGAASAGAADYAGGLFGKEGSLANYSRLKPIAHGLVQGGIREASGGKFIHGFLSGSFSSQFSGLGGVAAVIVGGTAEAIGGGKFANGAITAAMTAAFGRSGGGSGAGSSGGKDMPLDISWNDLTHFAGFVVNLPLAIPFKVANWAFGSFSDLLKIHPSYFGTGNHDGGGIIVGDSQGGSSGVFGASMSLVHWQGFWGDGDAFERGQFFGHNASTGPGQASNVLSSILDTVGQGVGIGLKNVGVGTGLKQYIGAGNGYGLTQGFRNGLTSNRSSYSTWGHNGTENEWK
ncbi:MAG: FG-GAP-like repeat-containing protein [Prosthecobacter sp.]